MNAAARARIARELKDILARYRDMGYFPSAAVRVFDRDGTLAHAETGDAKEDSLFDVASLTKIATATQALSLIDRGKWALDSEIADILPELNDHAAARERLQGVTLRRILTHTSGLPAWYPFYTRRGEDFFKALDHALLGAEREQGVVYSDLNFMLLGKAVERAFGKPLDRCLREELVAPLSLGDMTYHPAPGSHVIPSSYGNPIEEKMCADRGFAFDGFRPADRPVTGQVNDGNSYYYFNGVSGHAGIFANTAAYERLCRFYMVTDSMLMILAQREQPGAPGRGLGFQTGPSYPHGCGHTGFTGTGIYFSRTHDIGVVSMTNRLFYPQPNPQQTWEFRRALHEAVFALREDA